MCLAQHMNKEINRGINHKAVHFKGLCENYLSGPESSVVIQLLHTAVRHTMGGECVLSSDTMFVCIRKLIKQDLSKKLNFRRAPVQDLRNHAALRVQIVLGIELRASTDDVGSPLF